MIERRVEHLVGKSATGNAKDQGCLHQRNTKQLLSAIETLEQCHRYTTEICVTIRDVCRGHEEVQEAAS